MKMPVVVLLSQQMALSAGQVESLLSDESLSVHDILECPGKRNTVRLLPEANAFFAALERTTIRRLRQLPQVQVELVGGSLPKSEHKQAHAAGEADNWHLEYLEFSTEAVFTGKGVSVAVLDTGIDRLRLAGGLPLYGEFLTDTVGHGTQNASVISADWNNPDHQQVHGLARECDLYSVVVADHEGKVSPESFLAGLLWCYRNSIDVVSCSVSVLARPVTRQVFDIIAALLAERTVLVAASGTFSINNELVLPAASAYFTAVGAVDRNAVVLASTAVFSGSEPDACVELLAPGVDVLALDKVSRLPGNVTTSAAYTSIAAPQVAAAAALARQRYPNLSPREVIEVVKKAGRAANLPSPLQHARHLSFRNLT